MGSADSHELPRLFEKLLRSHDHERCLFSHAFVVVLIPFSPPLLVHWFLLVQSVLRVTCLLLLLHHTGSCSRPLRVDFLASMFTFGAFSLIYLPHMCSQFCRAFCLFNLLGFFMGSSSLAHVMFSTNHLDDVASLGLRLGLTFLKASDP